MFLGKLLFHSDAEDKDKAEEWFWGLGSNWGIGRVCHKFLHNTIWYVKSIDLSPLIAIIIVTRFEASRQKAESDWLIHARGLEECMVIYFFTGIVMKAFLSLSVIAFLFGMCSLAC